MTSLKGPLLGPLQAFILTYPVGIQWVWCRFLFC